VCSSDLEDPGRFGARRASAVVEVSCEATAGEGLEWRDEVAPHVTHEREEEGATEATAEETEEAIKAGVGPMKTLALLLSLTVFRCSDYDPANYSIERNGFGEYRVRLPWTVARDITSYKHRKYLSSYRPYPYPYHREWATQPILFPDSLSSERAIREHISWLTQRDSQLDSMRELGKWRAIR
jgi:hypothetical protein